MENAIIARPNNVLLFKTSQYSRFELMSLCILVEKKFELLVCVMGFLSRLAKTFHLLCLLSHFTPVKLFFETSFTVLYIRATT